jgi:hypothetical protein
MKYGFHLRECDQRREISDGLSRERFCETNFKKSDK